MSQTTSFKASVQKSVTKPSLGDDMNEKDLDAASYSSVTGNLTGKSYLTPGQNSKSLAAVS